MTHLKTFFFLIVGSLFKARKGRAMHVSHEHHSARAWPGAAAVMLAVALLPAACVTEEQFDNDPKGNFEALWRIIDQRYCFLDYKAEEYGLDWNEVHSEFARQIDGGMTEAQVFEVLGNMLARLRDGHVNMYAPFDQSRYWSWHEDFPANHSDSLERRYLGTGYMIASGLKYRKLECNIGYIRCSSFSNGFGEGNLDNILMHLATCNGLIIDLRNNGGGQLTAAEQLAARFVNKTTLVGYMRHKTGTGHSDFSSFEEQKLKPSSGLRWQKPVVVITNRSVYSAANEFVKYMKHCPQATIVGDKTGGGAGMPFTSELPNGWCVRFSACPMYDAKKQCTEFGIDPDIAIGLDQGDANKGIDTMIECAIDVIEKKRQEEQVL